MIDFPPFRLDPERAELRRGSEIVALRPRSFAVLRYLAERRGRVVTKPELLAAVWPDTHVSDMVLSVCISEIRHALGESTKPFRFIETLHRRGYRFRPPPARGFGDEPTNGGEPPLVGRTIELARLEDHWRSAWRGQRQVVFLSGDAGMGKTALIAAFLARIEADASLVSQGRCVPQRGHGEPFMPLLEGLGRLCVQPQGERLGDWLRQHAPSWLMQLPGLVSPAERATLQGAYRGLGRERMLREMVVGVEALTHESPLIIVLEDLHWSDTSTIDLIGALAQSQEPARLLLLATYRPVDAILADHPLRVLKSELHVRRLCSEIELEPLQLHDVGDLLAARVPAVRFSPVEVSAVHRQTGGNPLFLAYVCDQLLQPPPVATGAALHARLEGVLRRLPASLRGVIGQQFERLAPNERDVLRAASIAGIEFTTDVVAAALRQAPSRVEALCHALARRRELIAACETRRWPDGTETSTYQFSHPLYPEVIYEQVRPARRARLHQRIGERLEGAYGERRGEIAAELAAHFEAARDHSRAASYHRLAGEDALLRKAYPEAIHHFTDALEALEHLPDTGENRQHTLDVLVALGPPLAVSRGHSASEVERIYRHAWQLCERLGDPHQSFAVLAGIELHWRSRGQLVEAAEVARQLFLRARRSRDPALLIEGLRIIGTNRFWAADLAMAQKHLERAVRLSQRHRLPEAHRLAGYDPLVRCLGYLGTLNWLRGSPDQAGARAEEALARAREVDHAPSEVVGYILVAWTYILRRQPERVLELVDAAAAAASRHGFPFWNAVARIMRGWAMVSGGRAEEGLRTLHAGLADHAASGAGPPTVDFLMLLGDALRRDGRTADGLRVVDEGLAALPRFAQLYFEPELHRLKAELLAQQLPPRQPRKRTLDPAAIAIADEAEACIQRALALARRAGSRSLELRAAVSLGRLRLWRGKRRHAADELRTVLAAMSEGLDLPDVVEARALVRLIGEGRLRPVD